MDGERAEPGKFSIAGIAGLGCVVEVVVLGLAEGSVAVRGVVRAMPVGCPFWRTLLEDLTAAFGTYYVIAEAEVFVEH